jgi:hypothetical protein
MHTKEKKRKMRHGRRNQYPGNGPFRDVPPYQRPGYLYGGGRGRGYTGTDPTKCARFPWLTRWWWANPDSTTTGIAPPEAPSSEKEFLENQLGYLAKEMEQVKSRIEELGKTETQ